MAHFKLHKIYLKKAYFSHIRNIDTEEYFSGDYNIIIINIEHITNNNNLNLIKHNELTFIQSRIWLSRNSDCPSLCSDLWNRTGRRASLWGPRQEPFACSDISSLCWISRRSCCRSASFCPKVWRPHPVWRTWKKK